MFELTYSLTSNTVLIMLRINETKEINEMKWMNNEQSYCSRWYRVFRSSVVMPMISDQDTGKSYTFEKPLNKVYKHENEIGIEMSPS